MTDYFQQALQMPATPNAVDNSTTVEQAMLSATSTSPEAHANTINLARRLNVSPILVQGNEEWAKQQLAMTIDFDGLKDSYPATARYMANPDHAAVSRDDIMRQMAIEDTLRDADIPARQGIFAPEVRRQLIQNLKGQGVDTADAEAPAEPMGFFERVWSGIKKAEPLPFVSTVPQIYEIGEISGIASRIKDKTAEPSDWIKLLQYDQEMARGTTFGGKVAAVLTQLPSFAAEFALTGGAYTAGKTAGRQAGLLAAKAFLGASVRDVAENVALRGAVKGAGWVAGSAVRAAAMPHRVAASAMQRMLPEMKFDVGSENQIESIITDQNDGFAAIVGKAFLDTSIEVGTEMAGSVITKVTGIDALKAAVMTKWLGLKPTNTVSQFAQLMRKSGWDGPIGEMGEERFGELLRAATGLESMSFTPEQYLVELVAFSAVPFAGFLKDGPMMVRTANHNAQQAQAQVEFFTNLGENTQASQTLARVPGFQQLQAAYATENGPVQDLYAPMSAWVSYWESQNQDPREAARLVLGETDSYDQAKAAQHDLRIPLSAYVEHLAASEHNLTLAQDLRIGSHDAPTVRELQASTEEVSKQIQDMATAHQQVSKLEEEHQKVSEQVAALEQEVAGMDPATPEFEQKQSELLELKVQEQQVLDKWEIAMSQQDAAMQAPEASQHLADRSKELADSLVTSGAYRSQRQAEIHGKMQARMEYVAATRNGMTLPEFNSRFSLNISNGENNAPSTYSQSNEPGRAGDGGGGRAVGEYTPLAGAPSVKGATGPDPGLSAVAEQYARDNGIPVRRQAVYAEVDPDRAKRIAAAYDAMPHTPQDPVVLEAYHEMMRQVRAQYDALAAAGYRFWFTDPANDPYKGNPWNAMRDIRANQRMGVFPTEAGFGSGATDIDTSNNPLMADTGIQWGYGSEDGPKKRVLANDLFRAVHDAFGHGLEGSGFRAQGEENAWQAHVRLFTGRAIGAMTSETRGQNSWLNYGPHGEHNQTAKVEDTVFADQKTGLLPEEFWSDGIAPDEVETTLFQKATSRHPLDLAPAEYINGRGTVSTRQPSAVKSEESQKTLQIDLEAVNASPELKAGIAADLRAGVDRSDKKPKAGEPAPTSGASYLTDEQKKGTDEQVLRAFIDLAKGNLRWLWEKFPAEYRQRAKLWYVGANKIADAAADMYKITTEQAAGVFAVLSPQKDWFQNVSMGERIMDIWNRAKETDFLFTEELFSYVENNDIGKLKAKASREFKPKEFKPKKFNAKKSTISEEEFNAAEKLRKKEHRASEKAQLEDFQEKKNEVTEKFQEKAMKWAALRALYVGKTWSALPLDGRARLFRALDETTGDRSYRIILPEGGRGQVATTGDGGPATVAWSSYNFIAKALSIMDNGSLENISGNLGEEHKVRNFFNNISDPFNKNGYVTIDTHAVAAALLNALSGSSVEVADNFGGAGGDSNTGAFGTYGVYAEAYKELADELTAELGESVLAREVQSVTWEAIRLLFTKEQKTSGDLTKKIDNLWNQYANGKLSIDDLRENIWDLAGGIRPPSWADTSFGYDAQQGGVAGSPHGGPFIPLGSRAASVDSGLSSRGGAKERDGVVRGTTGATETVLGQPVFPETERLYQNDRTDTLTDAAQKLKRNEITKEEYNRIAAVEIPLRPFTEAPKPATLDEVKIGLGEYKAGDKLKKDMAQAPESIAPQVLESRLDIPAYREKGVWVVSLHEDRGSKSKGTAAAPIAYTSTAVLNDVTFKVHEEAALNIAAGKAKSTIATMRGAYVPQTAGATYKSAQQAMQDGWVQVGMNPLRHSFFYDKETEQPVVSASQVIQVGGLVLAKGVTYAPVDGSLYQTGGNMRGSITFNPADRGAERRVFTVAMLKKADASTFMHEAAHFWLEVMGDLGSREGAPTQTKADLQAIFAWLGVKDFSEIGVEQHEKFARGFEVYLMTGKAPVKEVRGMFSQFRSWLVRIYKDITQLDVELSDDIKGVFDRMVATDAELEAARAQENLNPVFMAKPEGMDDVAWGKYRELIAATAQTAQERLQAKLMAEMEKARTEQRKEETDFVRAEVTEELQAQREYIVLSILRDGVMPDKSEVVAPLQAFKLNKESLLSMSSVEKETMQKLRRLGVYSAQGGVSVDTAANLFGYGSADEMIRSITGVLPIKQAIKEETTRRMNERHPSLMADSVDFRAAAVEAIHNEHLDEVLAMEIQALQKQLRKDKAAVGRVAAAAPSPLGRIARRIMGGSEEEAFSALALMDPKSMAEAAKNAATRTLEGMRLQDIKVGAYLAAARRASAAATKAMTKGDFSEVLTQKQVELLNHSLFRMATEIKEKARKQVKFVRSFEKDAALARLGKAGPSYRDQVIGILERFNFRPISLTEAANRKSLAEWITAQEAKDLTVDIDESIRDAAFRKDYRELTAAELTAVHDAVAQIAGLARLKNKLLTAKDNREFSEVISEVTAVIRSNTKAKPREMGAETSWQFFAGSVDSFFSAHRKMASIIREMDGFVDNGPLYRAMMVPINEAASKEAVMNEKATISIKALFDVFTREEMRQMTRKQLVAGVTRDFNLSREDCIAIALNWGNEDNRKKLVDGYNGLTEGDVLKVLDTLTEKEWKFTQSVWDYVDTFWPEIKDKQERVYGIAPEKVERSPVVTKFGVFEGGYYPLKYAGARAEGEADADAAKQSMRGAALNASTKRGHTKGRVEGVERPIRLEFGVLFNHARDVIHDLSHHEMLIDVNRILKNGSVQGAMEEHYGEAMMRQLRTGLDAVATGNAHSEDRFTRALGHVRSGVSVSVMGYNLMTSMLQAFGLTQAIPRVGAGHMAKAVSQWLGSPSRMEGSLAWIQSKSEFMRLRAKTQNREITELRSTINPTKTSVITDSFFYLITRGQLLADIPTWLAGYNKAMESGVTEEEAIGLADQLVVDSMGGGQVKDLSAVQRGGPLQKMWTTFYSYFNATWNLNVEAVKQTDFKSPSDIARMTVDLLIMNSVPVALQFMLVAAMRGGLDDDKNWLEELAKKNLSYLLGQLVFIRELGGIVEGPGNYEGQAGSRFFTEAYKLTKQIEQGELDRGLWTELNKVSGILFHYPTVQVQRTVEGTISLWEGKTSNPFVLITGPSKDQR